MKIRSRESFRATTTFQTVSECEDASTRCCDRIELVERVYYSRLAAATPEKGERQCSPNQFCSFPLTLQPLRCSPFGSRTECGPDCCSRLQHFRRQHS